MKAIDLKVYINRNNQYLNIKSVQKIFIFGSWTEELLEYDENRKFINEITFFSFKTPEQSEAIAHFQITTTFQPEEAIMNERDQADSCNKTGKLIQKGRMQEQRVKMRQFKQDTGRQSLANYISYYSEIQSRKKQHFGSLNTIIISKITFKARIQKYNKGTSYSLKEVQM